MMTGTFDGHVIVEGNQGRGKVRVGRVSVRGGGRGEEGGTVSRRTRFKYRRWTKSGRD